MIPPKIAEKTAAFFCFLASALFFLPIAVRSTEDTLLFFSLSVSAAFLGFLLTGSCLARNTFCTLEEGLFCLDFVIAGVRRPELRFPVSDLTELVRLSGKHTLPRDRRILSFRTVFSKKNAYALSFRDGEEEVTVLADLPDDVADRLRKELDFRNRF